MAALLAFEIRYTQIVLSKYGELIEEQERANQDAAGSGWETGGAEETPVQPDPMLRELFRELARVAHPDHACGPEDERRRLKTMASASSAMHSGDLAQLEQILREWKEVPEDTGLLPGIRRMEHRLYHCTIRKAKLEGSSMWGLMEMEERLQAEGRDMLQEMADVVQGRIEACRSQNEQ